MVPFRPPFLSLSVFTVLTRCLLLLLTSITLQNAYINCFPSYLPIVALRFFQSTLLFPLALPLNGTSLQPFSLLRHLLFVSSTLINIPLFLSSHSCYLSLPPSSIQRQNTRELLLSWRVAISPFRPHMFPLLAFLCLPSLQYLPTSSPHERIEIKQMSLRPLFLPVRLSLLTIFPVISSSI